MREREDVMHIVCMYVHAKGSSYLSSSATNVKKTMIQISGQGKNAKKDSPEIKKKYPIGSPTL